MDRVILDAIPLRLDIETLARKVRLRKDPRYRDDLEQVAGDALAVGRPRALYKVAYIEAKGEDFVVADGVQLTSRVLRVNLEQAHRLFVYVATCGAELEEWARSVGDLLQSYWAETIKEIALAQALEATAEHIAERFPEHTSTMAPGSLDDWPLEEQRPLFDILGGAEQAIGVRLTESLLMLPTKSVSGVRFPAEESFESCRLCPRKKCPDRNAPYEKDLYERKYRGQP